MFDNPRIPMFFIGVLVLGFILMETTGWKFSTGTGRGGLGIRFESPDPETKSPYSFNPILKVDKNGVHLRAETGLPDGTVYRISMSREHEPRAPQTLWAEAGRFEPAWPTPEQIKLEDSIYFHDEIRTGLIKNGVAEGYIQFHPEEVQKLGCESCTMSPRLDLYLQVDQFEGQPEQLSLAPSKIIFLRAAVPYPKQN